MLTSPSTPLVAGAGRGPALVQEITSQLKRSILPEDLAHWTQDLETRLDRVQQHPEQGLGFIEEQVRQCTLELQRKVVERAMQAKADAVDECCSCCQTPLIERKRRVPKTIHCYCGPVRLLRTHGWCRKCEQWVFPADAALGLFDNSTASPLVQEMCALLVSKMPCEQAEPVASRVAGIQLSRSTMAREALRQGERAIQMREKQTTAPLVTPTALAAVGLEQPPKPFTLVIQMDTWNIRERDDWGKTQARLKRGEKIERWHWVYAATCFRLEQRVRKGKRRAVITERSDVATRQGIEPMMKQLHQEAMRRGLAQAKLVLVIADGAVWIWNAAKDRYPEALQRLDLFHANAYLWAVANQIHGANTPAARQWVKPLLKQVKDDKVAQVISILEELKPRLSPPSAKVTATTIEYYRSNQQRMKYVAGKKRGGQFWSIQGDEALLCLEIFWRNDHWELLFPHLSITSLSNN